MCRTTSDLRLWTCSSRRARRLRSLHSRIMAAGRTRFSHRCVPNAGVGSVGRSAVPVWFRPNEACVCAIPACLWWVRSSVSSLVWKPLGEGFLDLFLQGFLYLFLQGQRHCRKCANRCRIGPRRDVRQDEHGLRRGVHPRAQSRHS